MWVGAGAMPYLCTTKVLSYHGLLVYTNDIITHSVCGSVCLCVCMYVAMQIFAFKNKGIKCRWLETFLLLTSKKLYTIVYGGFFSLHWGKRERVSSFSSLKLSIPEIYLSEFIEMHYKLHSLCARENFI